MFNIHKQDWTIVWWRNYDNTLSCFDRIPERDGQTDRRTDRRNGYINIELTRDKNPHQIVEINGSLNANSRHGFAIQ